MLDYALILLLCAVPYLGSLRNGFVSDDQPLVRARVGRYVQRFRFPDAFSAGFWRDTDTESGAPAGAGAAADAGGSADAGTAGAADAGARAGGTRDYYRPLVVLSYALDARIWKEDPFGYHLTNLLLHVLAGGLVLALLRRWIRDRFLAAAGALLFAWHPIHAASVAWISGRTDLLAAVFLLVACLAWDRWSSGGKAATRAEPGPPRSGGAPAHRAAPWLLLSAAGYALALFAKEIALAFVPIVILHALARRRQASLAGVAPPRWPVAGFVLAGAVTVGYLAARAAAVGASDFASGVFRTNFRPGLPVAAYAYYLRAMIVPGTIHFYVPFALPGGWTDPRFLLFAAETAILLAAAAVLLARVPAAGFGLAWFACAVAPVAHLVVLPYKAPVAEYWAYVPSIGWVLAIAALAERASERLPRHALALPAVVALLAVGGGAQIPSRTRIFRSDEALLEHTTRVHPGYVDAWTSLATEYSKEGRMAEAASCLNEARRRDPTARGVSWAEGNVYLRRGMPDSARAAYERELRLDPGENQVRINLALALLETGDEAGASRCVRETLSRRPAYAATFRNQARTLEERGGAASFSWPAAEKSLRMAAGLLWALHQAGIVLDESEKMDLLDLELNLARPERIREAARLAAEDSRGPADAGGSSDSDHAGESPEARDAGGSTAAFLVPTAFHLAALLESADAATAAATAWRESTAAADWAQFIATRWRDTGRARLAEPVWKALRLAGRPVPASS